MRLALPAAVLAAAGATALLGLPGVLRAADESAKDTVERLMPQLLSDDDTVRTEAEKSLFLLGDAGRAELERMTRDTDPRRAVAALRLLQSPKWAKSAKDGGEQKLERDESDRAQPGADPRRLEDFRARIERQMEEVRRQMEQMDRTFTMSPQGFDIQGGALSPGSSGSIVEDDKTTKWSVDKDGRIKVTIKDGEDAKEETFEAKDLETLKKEHPEAASRIESVTGRGHTFVFRSGPEQRLKLFGQQVGPNGAWALRAPAQPVLGIEWTPVPDVLRDQIDLPEGGVVIETVVKDSLAEKLGMQRHDVLVEVQGKPVGGTPDVREALDGVKTGEKVTAVVVRKGVKKALETTK